MATTIIPPPGSSTGPCKHCDHVDCASLRAMADEECTRCGELIGYNREFYREAGFNYVHAECYEEAWAKAKAEKTP